MSNVGGESMFGIHKRKRGFFPTVDVVAWFFTNLFYSKNMIKGQVFLKS